MYNNTASISVSQSVIQPVSRFWVVRASFSFFLLKGYFLEIYKLKIPYTIPYIYVLSFLVYLFVSSRPLLIYVSLSYKSWPSLCNHHTSLSILSPFIPPPPPPPHTFPFPFHQTTPPLLPLLFYVTCIGREREFMGWVESY